MAMASPHSPYLLLATFITLSFHLALVVSTNPDLHPLLSFKAISDPSNKKLTTWNISTNPCTTWRGVTCLRNRVTCLVLENLNLTASTIFPLTSLTQLRILSLKRNRFEGPIPSLSNLTALRLLFLSYNNFSGEFPATVTSLRRLYRLDLSHNRLSGEIPNTVNHLTYLLTFRVDFNQITGHIPNINLSRLQDFNVSGNWLSGQIPESLSGFPVSAFSHNNPSLCGVPLSECKLKPKSKPVIPALASPLKPRNDAVYDKTRQQNGSPSMGVMILIAIVVGDVLVLVLVSLLLYCCFWRYYSKEGKQHDQSEVVTWPGTGKGKEGLSTKAVYKWCVEKGGNGMVFFEDVKRFELEELLRASAEMLGKGVFGTTYKAVLDDGTIVAVKRLKEVNVGTKREFEQGMELLGRLRHDNIVSLRAFYFDKDEKLLVSDYMPNGSLSWLLHGNRGPGRTPLDWTTRLKIAAGAAQGVAFIHNSCNHKLTHGNIKSTNILIDVARNARVSDFGLSISAPHSYSRPNGYHAPEASDGRKQTQNSDVYSFGVLLMEILTGKCPSAADGSTAAEVDLPRWVRSVEREQWKAEVFDLELMRYRDIEEEMEALLRIALACTVVAPHQRPSMSHVVRMIEELRWVNVSPCHDTLDSLLE